MSAVLAASGPSAYWYLTRSTGAVSLLLLTASVCLGVADVRRLSTPSMPRFVIDSLHRNTSLLALAFLAVHILTSLLDSFAPIALADAFIPFVGSYRPLWLGLGAVASDLLIALVLTSMLRARIGFRTWRLVHWSAYACWPIALVHSLGTGSDVKGSWLLAISIICILAVLAALAARALAAGDVSARLRGAALGGAGAFSLFLVLWLPSGPLGAEWARRAGTPSSLLHHARSK